MVSCSTARVNAPAGAASTQMADALSPKQTSTDRETTPKELPGSQSIQSPGVLVKEEQGDSGRGLTEQFNALGRAFQPGHAAGAGPAGRHREMFDHKQRSPCHQQVSARARPELRLGPGSGPGLTLIAGAGPGLGIGQG